MADLVRQHEFVEVPPGFRRLVEELADLAILILDQLDGDVEAEDGGDHEIEPDDEPSLGATAAVNHDEAWSPIQHALVDLEEQLED